jgi:hypothetical protein
LVLTKVSGSPKSHSKNVTKRLIILRNMLGNAGLIKFNKDPRWKARTLWHFRFRHSFQIEFSYPRRLEARYPPLSATLLCLPKHKLRSKTSPRIDGDGSLHPDFCQFAR